MKWAILAAGLWVSVTGFSQTEKGRFTLSGGSTLQVSNITTEQTGNSFNNVQLNGGLGYFVVNDVCLGVNGAYTSQSSYSQMNVMPALAVYLPVSTAVKPFAQVGVGYAKMSLNSESISGVALSCAGGVACFLNKNVSVDFGVMYQQNEYNSSKIKTLSGIFAFSIYL